MQEDIIKSCEAKKITKEIDTCNRCGAEVYMCEKCRSDYLSDDFYCVNGEHYCQCCFEDWYEEYDNELRIKQEMKNADD